MNRWLVKISLFVNYFVFAILLNSVGTVILQVQNTYGVSESAASVLEAFKEMAGLIVVFSALGGTTGSIITGTLFEHFGGRTAFYFSLVPMALILVSLCFFKRLSDNAMAAQANQ